MFATLWIAVSLEYDGMKYFDDDMIRFQTLFK